MIELKNIEMECLRVVFNYLYSGAAVIPPQQELVGIKAIQLADQWLIPRLVRLLSSQLMRSITAENCFLLVEGLSENIQSEEVKRLRCAAAMFCLKEYSSVLHEYDQDYEHLEKAIECLCSHPFK